MQINRKLMLLLMMFTAAIIADDKGDKNPVFRMYGGDLNRNMTASATNAPVSWDPETGENILWTAQLGSQTYTNALPYDGKIFIATNNEAERNPQLKGDRGVIMAFDQQTGKFLWQSTHEKLPSGMVNDWPLQGICSTPFVEGKRLWYVSNRCEIVCVDTEGFLDGENDGPYQDEENTSEIDADIIWKLDMIDELDVFPHNLAAGSPLIVGDILFTVTGNGVDEAQFGRVEGLSAEIVGRENRPDSGGNASIDWVSQ